MNEHKKFRVKTFSETMGEKKEENKVLKRHYVFYYDQGFKDLDSSEFKQEIVYLLLKNEAGDIRSPNESVIKFSVKGTSKMVNTKWKELFQDNFNSNKGFDKFYYEIAALKIDTKDELPFVVGNSNIKLNNDFQKDVVEPMKEKIEQEKKSKK